MALEPFEPNTVVAFGPADDVPLLSGKGYVDGRPAVYRCEHFACRAPLTDADQVRAGVDGIVGDASRVPAD